MGSRKISFLHESWACRKMKSNVSLCWSVADTFQSNYIEGCFAAILKLQIRYFTYLCDRGVKLTRPIFCCPRTEFGGKPHPGCLSWYPITGQCPAWAAAGNILHHTFFIHWMSFPRDRPWFRLQWHRWLHQRLSSNLCRAVPTVEPIKVICY